MQEIVNEQAWQFGAENKKLPKKRHELVKTNGWGFTDTYFALGNKTVVSRGNRFMFKDNSTFTSFFDWFTTNYDFYPEKPDQLPVVITDFPEPLFNTDFMDGIKQLNVDFSIDGEDRLYRSHGQSMPEISDIRNGKFGRIPDAVVWPQCHDEVLKVVALANSCNVVLIPFGGGSSVSGGVKCPDDERSIIALDTSQMNRLLWLNKNTLVACFEAGIVGRELVRSLAKQGLTMGHEPDSIDFSTLGGWVATRASGMKKNKYGNIEDIVLSVKMVTSCGVLERNIIAPRSSCGPDFNHIILGSEGTLGVITEVTFKVRPLPEVRTFDAIIFPDFSHGVNCLREIAKRQCQPASIRLVDNLQFQLSQTLKPDGSFLSKMLDSLKMFALERIKGYNLTTLSAATVLFEGDKDEVAKQKKLVYSIAGKFLGFSAGSANGENGYRLTYLVTYIRDFLLDFRCYGDSFETSVSWDKCEQLCYNTKTAIDEECRKRNITKYGVSCRITQIYDAGACVYFYFAYRDITKVNPTKNFEEIEHAARDAILASGGTLSHHHGVGKIRTKWYKKCISDVGVELFNATKRQLDPKNIFAVGNIVAQEQSTPSVSKL